MTRRWILTGAALVMLAACAPANAPTPQANSPTPSPASTQATRPPTPTAQSPTTLPVPSATAADLAPILNAPLADIGYAVPLIIRHVTTHTAILEFRLEASAQGRLYVVPDQPGEAIQEIPFDEAGGEFEVGGPGAGRRLSGSGRARVAKLAAAARLSRSAVGAGAFQDPAGHP